MYMDQSHHLYRLPPVFVYEAMHRQGENRQLITYSVRDGDLMNETRGGGLPPRHDALIQVARYGINEIGRSTTNYKKNWFGHKTIRSIHVEWLEPWFKGSQSWKILIAHSNIWY